ncbi:GNAT superfamily N-acetyltransferase [Paenibacillus sp. 4624]|jgi:GNAT superfamily N-acetyltransferase|uniref:GNAT family N-acetyltransferase n=1 Tax=Paenibacillus amylolyticus TaxID=1451 RepID=A0A5M9WUV8_PAEAM|nr:GNAT family N-acetyltransferase [Paenibacillus amylolyticus]KAA8785365.1 GNAT family N-acetyltransferase [Paenibacillus amylolyticus]
MSNVHIRLLTKQDAQVISESFQEQGWHKPPELYERYWEEQEKGKRVTLIAELNGQFAGYVNVIWTSQYPSFQEQGIPEINDFNVLMKFQRQGIGSKLMDHAEKVVKERSEVAGIGVGVYADYGKAQVLYAHRGYIPDGRGLHRDDHYLQPGEETIIDDEVVLYLTKKLL